MTEAQRRLWAADPSPSWDAIATAIGMELSPTSPDDPGNNVDFLVQVFWPGVGDVGLMRMSATNTRDS